MGRIAQARPSREENEPENSFIVAMASSLFLPKNQCKSKRRQRELMKAWERRKKNKSGNQPEMTEPPNESVRA